jgi:hypothetical protein
MIAKTMAHIVPGRANAYSRLLVGSESAIAAS